jgi:hypothetical protein
MSIEVWIDPYLYGRGSSVQMVDKLDQGLVPAELGPLDYKGLYNVISLATSFTVVHVCCCKILRLFFFRLFPGHFFERM